MTDLELFRKWCESVGHYHATEAIDRYMAMLESIDECGEQKDVDVVVEIKSVL